VLGGRQSGVHRIEDQLLAVDGAAEHRLRLGLKLAE
jgi:hypothetical protein